MARGAQRDTDRARAEARNAKNAKGSANQHGAKLLSQMSDAEKMREK